MSRIARLRNYEMNLSISAVYPNTQRALLLEMMTPTMQVMGSQKQSNLATSMSFIITVLATKTW